MSDYIKEKALQATLNKIESNRRQSNYFIRNIWKVIGFGIFVSIWAPTKAPDHLGFDRKSAVEVGELGYYELVVITALLYTLVCFIAHFVWKYQDKKALHKLLKRKLELEKELGI
ncbi:hypothetical protein [Luteirhabdus pelagi]|uniref:hypothetical protein n=1 Tax=Luteirhabdus pelagi TaxID=2792783 RepID=UPI00193A1BDC|nr:hypothetical protein [Luteirhabdus pelagi]